MSPPLTPPSAPIGTKLKTARGESNIGLRLLVYRRLLTIALLVLAFDQITKALIAARLPYGTYGEGRGAITVVQDFFYLVHVGNTGAAWSMFTGQSVFLAVLALVTLAGIFFWRHTLGLKALHTQVCFGLLCGGIVGNVVDRLRHGHVIDFLDFHFGSYVYPTFNVADSGICIGVVLYLWHSFRERK